MASKKILVQLDIQAASNLTSPLSGFVGFSAKADGLYQKIGTAPELRLLTSADVQNAILANGSITGAVSQAQIFTMGVKLYNLTQGYVPYASDATKLLSNSPIYTNGTNVGIGMTSPTAVLHLKAGTAIANTAPLKLTSGINLTTPESGAIEFSSSRLYFTPSTTRETVAFLSDITAASHAPVTIGAIGSAPNANGMSISGQTLSLQPASALYGGVLTNSTQTIAGAKTFASATTFTTVSYNYRSFTTGGSSNGGTARWSKLATFQTTTQYNNDQYEILLRSRYYAGKLYVVINSDSAVTTNLADFRFISDFINGQVPDIQIYRSQDSTYLSTWDVYIYSPGYTSYEYAENDTRNANNSGGGKVVTFYQNTYEDPPVGSIAVSYGPYFNGIISRPIGAKTTSFVGATINNVATSSTASIVKTGLSLLSTGTWNGTSATNIGLSVIVSGGTLNYAALFNGGNVGIGNNTPTSLLSVGATSQFQVNTTGAIVSATGITSSGTINFSSLTASKVVFTDGLKNLTSTGIGTAAQFIKGDGSLDSNTYLTSGSISGYVPYTGANDNVNLGAHHLSCNQVNSYSAVIGGIQIFTDYIQEDEVGIYHNDVYKIAALDIINFVYSYGGNKLRISNSGDVSIDKSLTIGNTNTSSYTDGGFLSVTTPDTNYAQFYFYSKETFEGFGIVQIIANPEEGIFLRSLSNDNSSSSYLEIRHWEFGFYTNQQKRLEIAQNGSINAFENTITSTGGFIGNASTATKLQTARTITIGNQSLSFDGTENISYTLSGIGIPVGTASQYFRGDLSLATFPTIHTGSGVDGRITFWNGTNSLSSSNDLQWNSTTKNLGVTGSVMANDISSNLTSTNSLSTNSFRLIATTTAGYVLTTDANGNGTWQAPTSGGSYTLPTATASLLGGVKIGSGITISSGVISVSTNYQAPITTGTTTQYFRGDLSLATFPTIHTGSGFNGGVTFWNGTNSMFAATELKWNNTSKNLSVTGGVSANNFSSNSMSTNTLFTQTFKLGSSTTAGYVLTTDANGNGTWQAPTGSGSYTLPTATASVLGGVKIGSGITISSGVISVSTNYEAPLTFTNGLSRTGNTVSFLGSLSGFVPYEGATMNVNLGSKRLTADNICVTTGSGVGKYLRDASGQGHAAWSDLSVASSTVIGGIKVGYGLQIDTAVLSVNPGVFIPYVGADRDVNLGSRSIYAYDFVLYSDINLKCNIESIPKHRIDIDYKQFEYKTNEGEKRYGVIAQELLSTAPEFVVKNGDYYAVKYTDLLVYEIVQLKEEIKELKSMLCR